jgi:hypothetical protein
MCLSETGFTSHPNFPEPWLFFTACHATQDDHLFQQYCSSLIVTSYAKTIQQRTTWKGTYKSEIYSWNFQKFKNYFLHSNFQFLKTQNQGSKRQNLRLLPIVPLLIIFVLYVLIWSSSTWTGRDTHVLLTGIHMCYTQGYTCVTHRGTHVLNAGVHILRSDFDPPQID